MGGGCGDAVGVVALECAYLEHVKGFSMLPYAWVDKDSVLSCFYGGDYPHEQ